MTTYCKIIKVESADFWGTEKWILTHECGKVEKRIRRSRGSRAEKPAPKRVKCEGAVLQNPMVQGKLEPIWQRGSSWSEVKRSAGPAEDSEVSG